MLFQTWLKILTLHTPTSLYLSYSLNSLKGGYIWDYTGDYYIIKVDTRS